jgi:hypothetical protein
VAISDLNVYRGGTFPNAPTKVIAEYIESPPATSVNIRKKHVDRPLKIENATLCNGQWTLLIVIKNEVKIRGKVSTIKELCKLAKGLGSPLDIVVFTKKEIKSTVRAELVGIKFKQVNLL